MDIDTRNLDNVDIIIGEENVELNADTSQETNVVLDTDDIDINVENQNIEFDAGTQTRIISEDKNYLHIQSVASDEWIIHHNLDKYPSVTVLDSANNEVVGEVTHIDRNNLIIKFAGGFSGKATLN